MTTQDHWRSPWRFAHERKSLLPASFFTTHRCARCTREFISQLITGYASISETNRRQKHIPKISERNHAGTSFGKPFRTGGNCIHVKLQQNILASSYKRPTSDMAFPVADDEGFGQSQIPLPSVPPIKSANYLCFKLSSKQCLNCNLELFPDSKIGLVKISPINSKESPSDYLIT